MQAHNHLRLTPPKIDHTVKVTINKDKYEDPEIEAISDEVGEIWTFTG